MRELSAAELLGVWERGMGALPAERGLLLLATAVPDCHADELATWPIGRRDMELMALRAALFGSNMPSTTRCPACGERLELELDGADVRATPAGAAAGQALSFATDGHEITFRLPNTRDLLSLDAAPDSSTAQRELLTRCVTEARREGATEAADALPPAVVEALAGEMERADPQANIWLDLSCPGCGHSWQALFDVVTYAWAEIDGWARRTLHEVASLATAYGWSEADILNMSAWRRSFYLQMAGK